MLIVSGGISDEGFSGSRVRDTEDKNRFTKEGAESLINSVREATKKTKTNNAGLNKISAASSIMAKEIAKNTEAVQKVLADDEKSQEQLVKVMEMMADAQEKTGEASVSAIEDLMKEIAILKEIGGTDLTNNLGLDEAQKSLASGNGSTISGSLFRRFTNVDEGVTGLDAVKQAFSREKLFGLNPTANTLKKRADANAKMSLQGSAISDLAKSVLGNKKEQVKAVQENAEGSAAFITGTDRASLDSQQVDLLEKILKQLKIMEKGGVTKQGVMSAALVGAIAGALPGILTTLVAGAGLLAIKAIIEALVDSNYVETTAEPILESREDMYKAGIGMSDEDQARRAEFASRPIERAKTSGLYDKDSVGNSEVDLNMLAASNNPAQLQAILDDDDISASDRMRVEKRINQLNTEGDLGPVRPSIEPSSAPTVTPEITPIDGRRTEGESVTELAPIGSRPLVDSNGNTVSEKVQAGASAKSSTTPLIQAGASEKSSTTPEMMNIKAKDVLGFVAEANFQHMMSPDPTPTADAVSNVSDLMENIMSSITNNIQNITNNNTSGGNTAPSILVSPSGTKNNEWNMIDYHKRIH